MIARLWHGWTKPEDAEHYENLIRNVVFADIEKKNIPGYKGMQLLRKDRENEVEFISMMWFEELENISSFVGEDYETAHVPEICKAVLIRFEERVDHFEIRHGLSY